MEIRNRVLWAEIVTSLDRGPGYFFFEQGEERDKSGDGIFAPPFLIRVLNSPAGRSARLCKTTQSAYPSISYRLARAGHLNKSTTLLLFYLNFRPTLRRYQGGRQAGRQARNRSRFIYFQLDFKIHARWSISNMAPRRLIKLNAPSIYDDGQMALRGRNSGFRLARRLLCLQRAMVVLSKTTRPRSYHSH